MNDIEILQAMNTEQNPLYWTKKQQNAAIENAVEALEKQKSKKPIERHYEEDGEKPYIKICCPNGCPVQVSQFDNYCCKCGQRLDWD